MGAQKVADSAHNAGLDTHNLDVSPQITLGSASYSPLAMASAYGTFAAQGMQTDPYTVLKVTDADGTVLYEAQPKSHRAFPADIANETTYDLSQVIQNGTGAYAQNLGRPAAGKTGNHEGKTAWFIGYTPQLVTAVAFHRELGKEKLAPLNYVAGMPVFTGAGYPTQIWTAFMSAALEGMQVAPLPPRPTPSVAPTPTYTPTPTPSPTPSPKPSPSETPKPSPSETPKPSPSPSESKSPSPSQEPSKPGTGGGNPGTGGTGGGNP
jgi:membrane peptidoglycan carboxypeptidase